MTNYVATISLRGCDPNITQEQLREALQIVLNNTLAKEIHINVRRASNHKKIRTPLFVHGQIKAKDVQERMTLLLDLSGKPGMNARMYTVEMAMIDNLNPEKPVCLFLQENNDVVPHPVTHNFAEDEELTRIP